MIKILTFKVWKLKSITRSYFGGYLFDLGEYTAWNPRSPTNLEGFVSHFSGFHFYWFIIE